MTILIWRKKEDPVPVGTSVFERRSIRETLCQKKGSFSQICVMPDSVPSYGRAVCVAGLGKVFLPLKTLENSEVLVPLPTP